MSDQIEHAKTALIEALIQATLNNRVDWIKTTPEAAQWKENMVEQRYAMLSEEGIFAVLSRMRDGSLEMILQIQETGCYRDHELSKTDGPKVELLLAKLYDSLPSTFKMIDDFQRVIELLQ